MRPRILKSVTVKKSVVPVLLCLALAGCFKSSEERAAEHFESGMELVAAGDLDRALVEFRNTLKFSANDTEARRQMAMIHLERGRTRQAYRNFLSVVEFKPNDLGGRISLSELAFDLGDWEEFERHASEAITLNTATPDPELTPTVDTFELAIRYRAAERAEDGPAIDAMLAEAKAMQDSTIDNGVLRRILISGYVLTDRYEDALEQLDRAIAANPDELNNYGGRLDMLSRLGDAEGVETELKRMVAQFPDDQNVKATYLRYLGSRGQLDEAEAFLRDEVDRAAPETRTEAFTTLVTFVLRVKGSEAAMSELDAALAETPNDKLTMMRASLRFDTGNQQEAISDIEALLSAEDSDMSPEDIREGQVLLAQMLESTGNEVGARKLVEEVLTADPTVPSALKMMAQWQIEEDNTEAAINGLRTALDVEPEDAEAMTLMAGAYRRAGNTDLMLNFLSLAVEATNNGPEESLTYARALVDQDKALLAETVLIDSLRIAPGNVNVLSLLGQIYLRLEDTGRTRQVIETLRNIENELAQTNAEALNIELVAREQGSDEALGLLETMASRSGDAGAQAKLGVIRARIANGDTEGALRYAQELVNQSPDDARFRYALALTNASLRNYEVAETQFAELVADEPAAVGAWLQLVRLQTNRGDAAAAEAALDDALSSNPSSPDLLWAKASLLQNQGNIDGAIEIFEQLYDSNSNSMIVANNLASLITTYRPDPENIERASRIARRLTDTTVPAFQDTYGWIQHLNGDHETALRYLEPAAAALSRDVAVQVHLGLVYAALNRPDDALAKLRGALEIDGPLSGNEGLIEQAHAKIAELEAGPAPESE